MKTLKSTIMFVLLIAAFVSPLASANLLIDPGFEANPLTTANNVLNNFTTYQGQWGPESATITGVDGGVTPAQLSKMLRMTNAGGVATQTFQVTDVTSYAAVIDAGSATVNISALFNAGSALSGAGSNVAVLFFSAASYSTQIGTPVSSGLTLDSLSATWQSNAVSGAIPVSTRWLVTQVAYNNASLQTADGSVYPGYVDAADLTITQIPEPTTLGLLALGSLVMRSKRKNVSSHNG